MIRLLEQQDHDSWINLAREVESLFGPMADLKEFREGIKECIKRKDAYGIENENKKLAGIIAVDRQRNEIVWLAVTKESRGKKYGDNLVKKAIVELEGNGDIYVQTFAEDISEGKSARVIYERNGFLYLKSTGQNPAGIDTEILVKNKK